LHRFFSLQKLYLWAELLAKLSFGLKGAILKRLL